MLGTGSWGLHFHDHSELHGAASAPGPTSGQMSGGGLIRGQALGVVGHHWGQQGQ